MLKELMTKLFATVLLIFGILAPLNALEISKIEQENDGELTLTFCNTFKIENIDLKKDSITPTVILPKEEELYENLAILNNDIATKIVASFENVYQITNECKSVPYSLISKRKVKNKPLVVTKVAFDRDISVEFLVSSYQKRTKTLYRIHTPVDLKFLKSGYQKNLRKWLIEETKDLLN